MTEGLRMAVGSSLITEIHYVESFAIQFDVKTRNIEAK
jgi:hypothetical protein